MNKYLPSIVCGFSAGVLLNVPVFKSGMCSLIVPLAVIIAIMLFKKANKLNRKILSKEAMIIGTFTGLYSAFFASVFDILITLITRTNLLIETLPEMKAAFNEFSGNPFISEAFKMMEIMADEIRETGFSAFYTLTVILNNFLFQTILGFFAGFAGLFIVNRNSNPDNKGDNNL